MSDKTSPTKTAKTDKPQTDKPKTDKPQTDKPKTDKPQTDKPHTEKPQTTGKTEGRPVKTDKPYHKTEYTDKGNKEETKEEDKGEKGEKGGYKGPRREPGEYHYRKPYIKRKDKGEREEITLETKVPELPKKNERINLPDDVHHEKQVATIYAEIEDLFAKMNDITKEEYNKVNSSARDTNTKSKSLRDLLTEKSDARKTLRAELEVLNKQMEGYRNALEEYHDKSSKYRQHMKKWFKKEDIVKELNHLKHEQSHGQLTIPEEKKIIKEIAELERALPYAEPLEKLEIEFGEIKEKKKVLKKLVDEKFKTLKLVSSEITDIHTQLDSFRDVISKNKEEAAPTVKKIQNEYRDKIKEKKDRITAIRTEHDEQWQKYEDQQELIRKIQYMQRVQERLKRDEERRKRYDEEQKLRDAEEIEQRMLTVPYREEMELCDLLISYLERLKPKADEEAVVEKTDEEKKAEIQSALQSDEWKKAKVQLIGNKREVDNDFFAPKQKKEKTKKKPQQQEKGGDSSVLQHSIELLNYFDSLKIPPPHSSTHLDDSVKSLKEKKAYFEKLSDEEKTKPVEERSKDTIEQKTKDEPKKEETEKKSPKKSKKHFDASEHDFPEIK